MTEQSAKKSTKKRWRKSEREPPGKGSKVKKGGTSGTAEDGHDLHGEGLRCSSPSIIKPESTRDPSSPGKDGDQLPSTPPMAPGKTKVSKKRKRTDHNGILDEYVNSETGDSTRPKNKKREERQWEGKHCQPYPDPAIDELLSEQSQRALSYVYERCRGIDTWKFNKARQNWLLRNVWSEQAVPERYIPLVLEYLAGIRGGAREKLIEECISRATASEGTPVQGTQPSDDCDKAGFTGQQANKSRVLSILHAFHKDS